ncbi:VWA domain-containing protein [candidate division WWE3 bacterium]|nr:VWA domain-containing protein [candidate division WWE3 bacterium]MBT7349811.1 VWA domain-containing protein [candidate division WWE3 bacterium]
MQSDVALNFRLGRNSYPATGAFVVVRSVLGLVPQNVTAGSLDVVFVLDCSWSMDSEIPTMRKAMKGVHAKLGPNDRVGIVGYSETAFPVVPLVSAREFPQHFGAIDTQIRGLGTTYAEHGLAIAKAWLATSQAATKLIVLITDGDETDKTDGQNRAAAVLSGSDIHIVPVTLDPSVPQAFFDKLMAESPDPIAPIMAPQALTSEISLAALPAQIVDKVRQIVGDNVQIRVEFSGFTELKSVYQLSPDPRAIDLVADGDGWILNVKGPLPADGMDICLVAEYESPEEDDAPVDSPFLNHASMAWEDANTGATMTAVIDPVTIRFEKPGDEDTTVDPALMTLFRTVMIQQNIDKGLSLAAVGSVSQSLAALQDAKSIAAKTDGADSLEDLIAMLTDQVASGSLSADAVGKSVAAASQVAQTALDKLSK